MFQGTGIDAVRAPLSIPTDRYWAESLGVHAFVAQTSFIIAARSGLPAQTLDRLPAELRVDNLSWASFGVVTQNHLIDGDLAVRTVCGLSRMCRTRAWGRPPTYCEAAPDVVGLSQVARQYADATAKVRKFASSVDLKQ